MKYTILLLLSFFINQQALSVEPSKNIKFNEYVTKRKLVDGMSYDLYRAMKNTKFWVYVKINGPRNFAFVITENSKTGKGTLIASQRKKPIKKMVLRRKLPKTNIVKLSGDEILGYIYPDTELSFLIEETNISLSVNNVKKLKNIMKSNNAK
jgi:hypothetical protein